MDAAFKRGLHENSFQFKRSLDRIVDKYSKLQDLDEGLEVDLANTQHRTLARYMKLSRQRLNNLESKNLTDMRDEPLRARDIPGNSQLDFTYEDGGADDTSASSSQYSGDDDDDVMSQSNMTELTVGSLEESERNFSETELQPEDQDEELEMTLRRQGSSFVELYPSMIGRIERARQRQNLSMAADSVLRRYHRWRQQSREVSLNNTLRHSNPGKMTGRMQLKETSNSPERRQFMVTKSVPRSPFTTNRLALQADQPSPVRERSPLRREWRHSVCEIDLSRQFFETSKSQETSLSQIYTMSEQLGEQPCTYVGSPSRPCYRSAKSSLDQSLRSKRHSLSAHSAQAPGCSTYASEVSFAERSGIYSSPVRQSPLKSQMINSLSRSPYAFSRSPKDRSVESFSREPVRGRSRSTSLSSTPQKPVVPQRMLYPQNSHPSLQPQLHSPQSATAGRPRLRRHLSFDSSLPSTGVSYSPKELDEKFLTLYHKFVCLNKSSFFNSHPCRICARYPEASRARSSSALAALALSPHCSILRKRNRELGWGDHPLSKRSRDECYTSSPGSKRHGNEMVRRRLCRSELSGDDLFYSSSKHNMCNKVSTQQRSADTHQEARMRQGRPVSAAEFSVLCGSHESSMANCSSPRK
ncbi:uncharacterized protein [Paralichthys olivaceus]|uniref:uncharacterized protein n=1 Tax=Paralichthys olivaceus TaxID=8255 RepID=UPI003752822D